MAYSAQKWSTAAPQAATQKSQPRGLAGRREAIIAPMIEKLSATRVSRPRIRRRKRLDERSSGPREGGLALSAPRRMRTVTTPTKPRCGGSSHRLLISVVPLPFLSRPHSTALPSPKRYEVEGRTNFLELRACEVRRIPLLGTSVNKRLSSLLSRLAPEPRYPSCDGYGQPYGYELAYSVPCPNPHQHLPKEAPRVQDAPIHVALHVTPKWRVLPALQVRVPYNQH